MRGFKMGTLDHMHLLVPDRYQAARWYQENLGFEIMKQYEAWAEVDGGPLHISADGGRSALALFERGQHPEFKVETWVAFRVDASQFVTFANGLLSTNISGTNGEPLKRESVVDHDLCYAYYFQDLYANRFELDCYDYDDVKRELIQKHALTPVRFW
jgi:hypothetical protein